MDFTDMSDAEIFTIATPLMDNLMAASMDRDHTAHIRDFTDRLKDIVTPDHLAKACEHIQSTKGLFTHREFVAIFKRPDSAIIVWKQFFDQAQGEFKAEMALVQVDGQYKVDHAAVF